jgi:hypothetical protein
MRRVPQYTEWNVSKDQRDEEKRCAEASDNDIQIIFDAEVRRRFGEAISRAAVNSKTSGDKRKR